MYLTDDAMLCDDRDIEAGRCTIKTREGRVKASVPSRERRVPCPSEYNVSQQARFGTMWSSSQPSMLEGHGGVGKRLPSTCSDSIKWLTTEPQGSRSATVPQLKVSINTQFAKWGEGHPKEATFSVSTPFKRPIMPEGYEVGLIDIELVTKENSPSRLNHITTGQHEKAKKDFTKARSLSYKVTLEQRLLFGSNPERNGGGGWSRRGIENHDSLGRFTGRIAFGSIKPSKDQSFRINRNTMMEDNNAQGAGGGGTPLPLLWAPTGY